MRSPEVLAICGSNSQKSINLSLIKIIRTMMKDKLNIRVYDGPNKLPHFSTDQDTEFPSPEVLEFRKMIRESDGILICSPEYAMGVPGSLKNAIDWTVSSAEFSKKPTALITASSLGEKAHQSLKDILRIIEAQLPDENCLLISHAKTKIRDEKIVDEKTEMAIRTLLENFVKTVQANSN